MGSRANMSSSGIGSIRGKYRHGCAVKKSALKSWIYGNGHTQPYVARRLGMDVEDFKDRLRTQKNFSPEQIKKLVYLMGARRAINVILFPSYREKMRVQEETFGGKR